MTDQGYCHYTLVIDRSGSMASIRDATQEGIRGFIEEQRKIPGKKTLSLCQFDTEHDTVHWFAGLDEVEDYTLVPGGGTALLDAVGTAITLTGVRLAVIPEDQRPGKVVFVIATDGEENSSKEYKRDDIRGMITHQQDKYNWKFTYIGANQDSFAEAGSLGINLNSTMNYAATGIGTRKAWIGAADASADYAGGQSAGITYTGEQRNEAQEKK